MAAELYPGGSERRLPSPEGANLLGVLVEPSPDFGACEALVLQTSRMIRPKELLLAVQQRRVI